MPNFKNSNEFHQDKLASKKEKAIMEQQRMLAQRMNRPPPPPPQSTSSSRGKPPGILKAGGLTIGRKPTSQEPSLKQRTSSKAVDAEPLSAAPKAPLKKPSSAAALKRPSLKRPSQKISKAASLARAKSSVASETVDLTTTDDVDTTQRVGGGTKIQRKKKVTESLGINSTGSRLASLIQQSSATVEGASSTGSYSKDYTPEDFWKGIREWDIVVDLAKQQQGSLFDEEANEDTSTSRTVSLPDTFISQRHYIAAWAPLCIAEARAQLLSDFCTDTGQCQNKAALLFEVDVEMTWKTGRRNQAPIVTSEVDVADMNYCNVLLKTKNRGDGAGVSCYAHDICCLIPTRHQELFERLIRNLPIADAIRLNPDPTEFLKKCAVVGHTEVSRKEVNGLILKISKRRWAQLGASSMFFCRIGGSISSLREFTALCNVKMNPLLPSLLGQHLHAQEATRKTRAPPKRALSSTHEKERLLQEMGGVQALGKGFTAYAKNKYNPSQLMAISASSQGYGEGGFTLIKGPPGTGKTTTLVAILNSLHIRQYNKYYEEVRRISTMRFGSAQQSALETARRAKPRLLVCAPSNAAVDNIILKIMEDGFVDGSGQRYNPSMIRVGVGKSSAVQDVALETKVDQILAENLDLGQLENSIAALRMEMQRIASDISRCRKRIHAIAGASSWPLGKDWEIRIDEDNFDQTGQVYYVNHKDKSTSYECPPPPEPGETQFEARAMPEYKAHTAKMVKLVESYFAAKSNLERCTIIQGSLSSGSRHYEVRQNLESHVLNSVHMVMTTLGTSGNRVMEAADKFEVVVVDEAAQSVEPSTLSALQLGSRHAVLVGDPQQLPATIFNVSGRTTKYDRSLFQRLEEAGQEVYMLNEQYRMHPQISRFPRHIFYHGNLLDGPNVVNPNYGNPLIKVVASCVPNFKPFTVLDLDSTEERDGVSLSNSAEAHLAVHLYLSLKERTGGISAKSRVAVITPYAQQAGMLRRLFANALGNQYERFVEVGTVDGFQGREANIVIFSAVRADGSHGIGFLSDVRRMNVALTRAKHMLFVIARCESIIVNPYWEDLVTHARDTKAIVHVPLLNDTRSGKPSFGPMRSWQLEGDGGVSAEFTEMPQPVDPRKKKQQFDPGPFGTATVPPSDPRKRKVFPGPFGAPADPRSQTRDSGPFGAVPVQPSDPRKRKKVADNGPFGEPSKQTTAAGAGPFGSATVPPTDPRQRSKDHPPFGATTRPLDPRRSRAGSGSFDTKNDRPTESRKHKRNPGPFG